MPGYLFASEEHENFATGDGSVTYMLQDMRTPGAIRADNPHAKVVFALRYVCVLPLYLSLGLFICLLVCLFFLHFRSSLCLSSSGIFFNLSLFHVDHYIIEERVPGTYQVEL